MRWLAVILLLIGAYGADLVFFHGQGTENVTEAARSFGNDVNRTVRYYILAPLRL